MPELEKTLANVVSTPTLCPVSIDSVPLELHSEGFEEA